MSTTPARASYRPQLDGLRTLAVLLVMAHHWMPKSITRGIHWGGIGVDLFFCLSGFLITGILLNVRSFVENGEQGIGYTARQFFMRRLVRIFPLYYLVLALTLPWLEVSGATQASLWTYTYNVYGGLTANMNGVVSHFWSLAVEEQFYLLWPWVILAIPRRRLEAVLWITVLVGPLTRLFLLQSDVGAEAVRTLTPACLDTLGLGSLMAWKVHRGGLERVARGPLATGLFALGLPLLVTGAWLQLGRRSGAELETWRVMITSTRAPLLAWLVLRGALGFGGIAGRFLSCGPMVYLGRISYGLYVYHAFALFLPGSSLHPLLRFCVWGAATVAVASVSWHLFEARVNGLKEHFPYRKARRCGADPPGPSRIAA
ncbi:MAG: acyltransferase [Planctomycetes bacterium]|jgi:peptidoglycan/LPS O-acetylase OafA/YrhL|nr:acyltransferase [Planctomycetota bacterium]